MATVPGMVRSLLRRAAVVTSAAALICFCSCERHRASELAEEGEHGKTEGAGDKKAHGKSEQAAHDTEHGDTQSRATTAMSVTPPPASPSPTAANFFPTASPH